MVHSSEDGTLPLDTVTVTDLKNVAHCARVVYFEKCWPDVRPRVYAMDAGDEAHQEERARARRRRLTMYGLPDGERRFNVRLYDPGMGLVGVIDELVIGPDAVYYPVDYKLSVKVSDSFALQVAAYALLVEVHFGVAVEAGYIYLIGQRQLERVPITAALRAQVRDGLAQIRHIMYTERMPPRVRERAKCRVCEFRRFCNDVV
jgi:CRISPR-associated exonuclease Cas4